VQSSTYWSATTLAGNTSNAWGVGFFSGGVGNVDKGFSDFVWCARGGMNADAY
jgi:hypothetical protein